VILILEILVVSIKIKILINNLKNKLKNKLSLMIIKLNKILALRQM